MHAIVCLLLLACNDYGLRTPADVGDDVGGDGEDGADGGDGPDRPGWGVDDPAQDDPDDGPGWWSDDGSDGEGWGGQDDPEVFSDCLTLAEGWDLGQVGARYQGGTHILRNDGGGPICMDDWYAFFSEETQDSGLGRHGVSGTDPIEIGGPGNQPFSYLGASDPAWFCIEQTQLTAPTESFWFFGARVPEPLRSAMEGGTQALQEAVWATIAHEPILLVGRVDNVVDLSVGEERRIDVRVLNLGRVDGSATISENVPAYYVVTDAGSASASEESDGTTTLTWTVELDAAIDTPAHAPTIYDDAILSYDVALVSCPGDRTVGTRPRSAYDAAAGERHAEGSNLVTYCD